MKVFCVFGSQLPRNSINSRLATESSSHGSQMNCLSPNPCMKLSQTQFCIAWKMASSSLGHLILIREATTVDQPFQSQCLGGDCTASTSNTSSWVVGGAGFLTHTLFYAREQTPRIRQHSPRCDVHRGGSLCDVAFKL